MRAPAGLALAVVGVSACSSVFPSVGPTPDPFAWSRTPLAPNMQLAQTATASDACLAHKPDGLALVIQDQRTAFSAAFLIAGHNYLGGCYVTLGGESNGDSQSGLVTPLADALVVDERSSSTTDGERTTMLGGRGQPVVDRIVVQLADGTQLDASVRNGYWLCYWPGDLVATRLTAFDVTGIQVAALSDPTGEWQPK